MNNTSYYTHSKDTSTYYHSCTTGLPINLPAIMSRYVVGRFSIPLINTSLPCISSAPIYMNTLILSL